MRGAPGWSSASTMHASRRSSAARRASSMRRSEEHTSELQSQSNLVCRLLLEKKKKCRQQIESLRHKTDKHRKWWGGYPFSFSYMKMLSTNFTKSFVGDPESCVNTEWTSKCLS